MSRKLFDKRKKHFVGMCRRCNAVVGVPVLFRASTRHLAEIKHKYYAEKHKTGCTTYLVWMQ